MKRWVEVLTYVKLNLFSNGTNQNFACKNNHVNLSNSKIIKFLLLFVSDNFWLVCNKLNDTWILHEQYFFNTKKMSRLMDF